MFNFTTAMIFVRQLLIAFGSVAVAKGVIDQGSLAALVDNAMTAISAIGVVVTILWGLWRDRPVGVLSRAAQIPGVQQIVTTLALADKVPSAKVVPPPGR